MKNSLQHVVSLPVAHESFNTVSNNGLSKNNEIVCTNGFMISLTDIFKCLLICLLLSSTIEVFGEGIPVTGGKQKIPNTPGPVNNASEIKLVNNTGMDMWDMRVILYKQGSFKKVEANHGGVSDAGPAGIGVKSSHIKFTKAVKNGEKIVVKMETTAPNDTIYIIPTDTLGADIMVNRDLNPAQAPGGNNQKKGNTPTPLKGGKVTVHFDGSNFPALVFVNQSGQEVCDMKITAVKKGNTSSKIDSVFVNDKKVYGAPPSASSVHVYFPCVPVGGTVKITVKVAGSTEVDSYTLSPTNKDSADVTAMDTLKKAPYDGGKPGKTIKLGSGTTSSRVSTAFVNETGQDICDAYIKTTKPVKKVIVNGKEWVKDTTGAQNGMIHVVCGTEPCIPNGQTMTVTIILQNGTIEEYTIIPTSSLGNIIVVANLTGGSNQFLMPNATSAFGIQGRSGSLVAINESCSPISQLVFTSPDPGITVTGASSSSPYTFNVPTGTLTFTPPIPSGSPLDVTFGLNQLLPYSPTDSFPYTTINLFGPGSLPFDGWWWTTPSSFPSATDGAIDFAMTAGAGPFTYLWSNGTTTEDLSGISAGTYTVTVSSPSDCMHKIIPVGSKQPVIEILPINVWCHGGHDGSAIAYADGISAPLNYLWSNGQTSQMATGLGTGTFTLSVTSPIGYSWAGTVTLTEPTLLVLTGTTTKLNCNGDHSGAINIVAAGGNTPYNFKWNNGSTIQNRTGLASGSYTTTVTDGYGCSLTASYKVKQPLVLNVSATGTDVSCGGGTNGSATGIVTGGTKPYQYNWSNSMTTSAITGLSAGSYNLTVTDVKGCVNSTGSVLVNQPPPMNINVMPVSQNQAMAQVFGGVPPYQYFWNTIPPQNTPIANGLQPGQTYTVSVMDAHGCMQTGMITMPFSRVESSGQSFEVTAAPNPTTGFLNVRFDAATIEVYELRLLSMTGQVVYTEDLIMNAAGHTFDFSPFAKGIYTLKITSGEKLSVVKLVIN